MEANVVQQGPQDLVQQPVQRVVANTIGLESGDFRLETNDLAIRIVWAAGRVVACGVLPKR